MPRPGSAAATRSRKSQAAGAEQREVHHERVDPHGHELLDRAAAPRAAVLPAETSARLTRTRTKPESESRMARPHGSRVIAAVSRRSESLRARRRNAFHSLFTAGQRSDNGLSAHGWHFRASMEAAITRGIAGEIEIRPTSTSRSPRRAPQPDRARARAAHRPRRAPRPDREPRGAVPRRSGASRTARRTARSTSTWASCARSSNEALPGARSSTRISASATASSPGPDASSHLFHTRATSG